ncbi:MAG: NAD(P)-binding protein, partial [Balneolaceae bacterium]|nr:NAD(P)-binding protein [Balneolaceae bacterium]
MIQKTNNFDVIVAGSGMGGMTAAALLASEGLSVLILEASHVPGGCSS